MNLKIKKSLFGICNIIVIVIFLSCVTLKEHVTCPFWFTQAEVHAMQLPSALGIERFHMTSRQPYWCSKTHGTEAMLVYK